MSTEIFDIWAIVQLFGHQETAGRITEKTIAGQGFIQVNVPDLNDQKGFTRLYGPSAIYQIIPTTEEVVKAYLGKNYREPIQVWQLALPERSMVEMDEEDEEEVPF